DPERLDRSRSEREDEADAVVGVHLQVLIGSLVALAHSGSDEAFVPRPVREAERASTAVLPCEFDRSPNGRDVVAHDFVAPASVLRADPLIRTNQRAHLDRCLRIRDFPDVRMACGLENRLRQLHVAHICAGTRVENRGVVAVEGSRIVEWPSSRRKLYHVVLGAPETLDWDRPPIWPPRLRAFDTFVHLVHDLIYLRVEDPQGELLRVIEERARDPPQH